MSDPGWWWVGGGFAGFHAARSLSRRLGDGSVPAHPEVFACGDAAAVPDVTRPAGPRP